MRRSLRGDGAGPRGCARGEARAFRAVLERLAQADEPILLTGETGTGKEVAARYVHRRSRRAQAPFVARQHGLPPRDLVESELFGHARGSFTGADRRKPGLLEETGDGMLFLDEIAELPLEAPTEAPSGPRDARIPARR
jgi:two-component system response regulator HydG